MQDKGKASQYLRVSYNQTPLNFAEWHNRSRKVIRVHKKQIFLKQFLGARFHTPDHFFPEKLGAFKSLSGDCDKKKPWEGWQA